MGNMTRKVLLFSVAVAVAMNWAANARANQLEITISENGYTPTVVSALPSGQTLTLSGTYAGAPDFYFPGFTATSNSVPGSAQGRIEGTGSIVLIGDPQTLTIIVSDEFTTPSGPNYQMSSSSSYTSVLSGSGGSFTFQSFGQTVPSALDDYVPLSGSGSIGPPSITPFTATNGYTLTQDYVWTATGETFSFSPTGSTIVSAVPEPSSLINLAGLGSLALGFLGIRGFFRKAC
jgi:hypothetical protein